MRARWRAIVDIRQLREANRSRRQRALRRLLSQKSRRLASYHSIQLTHWYSSPTLIFADIFDVRSTLSLEVSQMSAHFNKLVTLCNNKIVFDFNINGILLIVAVAHDAAH